MQYKSMLSYDLRRPRILIRTRLRLVLGEVTARSPRDYGSCLCSEMIRVFHNNQPLFLNKDPLLENNPALFYGIFPHFYPLYNKRATRSDSLFVNGVVSITSCPRTQRHSQNKCSDAAKIGVFSVVFHIFLHLISLFCPNGHFFPKFFVSLQLLSAYGG